MICSIRNGAERLACLAGICITIPGIHYYFALTNDGRLGPRRDVFTGIFDKGRNLGPSSEEDRHTQAPFVCLVRPAGSSVEISLPRQLTSASCFLFSFFFFATPHTVFRTYCPSPSLAPENARLPLLFVLSLFLCVMLLQSGAVAKSSSSRSVREQRADGGERPNRDGSAARRTTVSSSRN